MTWGSAAELMDTKTRVLKLLGTGVSQEVCATALGVSPAYVSQLMADETFKAQVQELRFKYLQEATERDNKYNTIEDKLLTRLEEVVPYIVKPREVLSALVVVNNAKRRGQSAPEQVHIHQQIVNLQMPQVIREKFIVDGQNQIVQAGDKELVTMGSKKFGEFAGQKLLEQAVQKKLIENTAAKQTGAVRENERVRGTAEESAGPERATATP